MQGSAARLLLASGSKPLKRCLKFWSHGFRSDEFGSDDLRRDEFRRDKFRRDEFRGDEFRRDEFEFLKCFNYSLQNLFL